MPLRRASATPGTLLSASVVCSILALTSLREHVHAVRLTSQDDCSLVPECRHANVENESSLMNPHASPPVMECDGLSIAVSPPLCSRRCAQTSGCRGLRRRLRSLSASMERSSTSRSPQTKTPSGTHWRALTRRSTISRLGSARWTQVSSEVPTLCAQHCPMSCASASRCTPHQLCTTSARPLDSPVPAAKSFSEAHPSVVNRHSPLPPFVRNPS